ncbi:class I SAM-dependent methyltransferase [Thermoleophilum album]|uniref:class I SAM-dependent methyltransferase n=1 Tax=Thermoleophilum album TaxID=29539 RepID=UPI001C40B5E6|nr:methyltransferase domain-containing protein [Thermoleophilum album]
MPVLPALLGRRPASLHHARAVAEALGPLAGARVLEVGPGTGYYTLPVADWIGAGGRLDIFDVQQDMLDLTTRRARARGLDNIVATQGDARSLPYDDRSFDAAFLVSVPGEIPDQDDALRELARVLRPGGRLVVGELFGDPHWVAPGALQRRAETAGLRFEERIGRPLAYFARLSRPTGAWTPTIVADDDERRER